MLVPEKFMAEDPIFPVKGLHDDLHLYHRHGHRHHAHANGVLHYHHGDDVPWSYYVGPQKMIAKLVCNVGITWYDNNKSSP